MGFMEWLNSLFCKGTNEELQVCNANLSQCDIDLNNAQKKLLADTQYYEDRIKTLTEQLNENTVGFVNAKTFIKSTTAINNISPFYPGVQGVPQADGEYYTTDLDSWKAFLGKVQAKISEKWTTEVFDCDDFALEMASLVTQSVFKSGYDHQLAFGLAWSENHAFNTFIDSSGKVWIFEPQTGEVIGEYKKIGYSGSGGDYQNVNEVWFLG